MPATSGRKISELTAASAAAETDYVAGVDATAGTTKRFLVSLLRKVRVMTGSTTYGPRAAIRFIAGGADMTINVSDDSVNDRVDVTITNTLGPGSPAHKLFLWQNYT